MTQKLISTTGIRTGELAIALYIIGFSVLLAILEVFRNSLPNVDILLKFIFWTVFFLAPLALGSTVLLGEIVSDTNNSSYFFGGTAVLTLLGVSFCLYAYFNPSEGGGLIVAHLISYGIGLVFSVIILSKHVVLRILPRDGDPEPVTRDVS
ncbi:hypothetical protein [Natrialba asiatica]|uniref:hypothetical protein n=1 Tax=Natrialba asiatica TaxID=64602 RepID=UPI0012681BD2|nr:hypothetical protein [Natrialba asiatica]